MEVKQPTVGPIVGYTTARAARILIRGELEITAAGIRRCFGVMRWREVGSTAWSAPLFNKLSSNFDMTGIFVLQDLAADTQYEYEAGWFFVDAELATVQQFTDQQLKWPVIAADDVRMLRSSTESATDERNYAVGSCRYLLRFLGGSFFDDRGDKSFRSILRQHEDHRLDGVFMIGDQIYADDLKFVHPDTTLDQFLSRYRSAFSQPHIRRLMSRVPTYMILDDHEIEDDWPASATDKDLTTLYPSAMHAYQIYQCSHSPVLDVVDGRIDGTPQHFWYNFTDGCADWFVMDVRTERSLTTNTRQIISKTQMQNVKRWLADGSGRIKFIVSSVPVFPDVDNDNKDKWGGFAAQRAELLEHIRVQRIRKVVFVSGDVHCSFVTRLDCPDDSGCRVHAIVSSSFFWPYPHPHRPQFRFGELSSNAAPQTRYVSKLLSEVHSNDNFARITARPSGVQVAYFSRKGEALGEPVSFQF